MLCIPTGHTPTVPFCRSWFQDKSKKNLNRGSNSYRSKNSELFGPAFSSGTLRAELASLHLWNRQAVQETPLVHGFAMSQTPAEPAAQPQPPAQVLLPVCFPRAPIKKQAQNTFLLAFGAYSGLTLHNHGLFLFSLFM